jgi:hypothetical protein
MNRSLTKTALAHRHWSQSRNPGIESTIHGRRPNIVHCVRPRDRMDDSKSIRRPFKQPEGRRGYCGGGIAAVWTMLGRSPRRRSAQRLTPGTRCQHLWDLRLDRKSQSKGCLDRTYNPSHFPACRPGTYFGQSASGKLCSVSTAPNFPLARGKLFFLLGFCHCGHRRCGHDISVTVKPLFIRVSLF